MVALELLNWQEEHLFNKGFVVVNAENIRVINEVRNELSVELKRESGFSEITLENYHEFFSDDQHHYMLQKKMTDFFKASNFHHRIIKSNLNSFRFLLGPDLDLQKDPYLRMARPGKLRDNIGYHRDTFYGTAANELSVLVPFVDLSSENCLSIYPGSHVISDEAFEVVSEDSESVKKGSDLNKIGFLYSAKKIKNDIDSFMEPVPLKVGEILIFMLSVIHGCVVNNSHVTRWSSDMRVRNIFYPENENLKEGYYEKLNRSAILRCDQLYSGKGILSVQNIS